MLATTMTMTSCSALCAAILSLVVSACGLTAQRGPGYAELESLGVFDTDRTMVISIGPTLLRFAARHIEDEPEIRAMLESLEGVRIRIYEVDGDPLKVAARIDRLGSRLEDDGWDPVMLVRDSDERTQLFLKSFRGQVCGLTLLSSDGDSEAVVINLIGDIQPQRFSDVMIALDIDEGGAQDVQVSSEPDVPTPAATDTPTRG